MSCLFAQDESSQHDNIHTITKTISNHGINFFTKIIIHISII
jgi:hypothetical protein